VVTIETDQVFVIRGRRPPDQGWCRQCAESVRLVTTSQAASLVQVSSRLIYYWVATEKLHFDETADGLLLICLNSLFDHFAQEQAKENSEDGKEHYVGASH
jgi:hypothetical protein